MLAKQKTMNVRQPSPLPFLLRSFCENSSSVEVLSFDFQCVCHVIDSFQVQIRSIDVVLLSGVSKEYPHLTRERGNAVRYYCSASVQIYSSVFSLDTNTLHLKIVRQTWEIQASQNGNLQCNRNQRF